MASDGEQKRKRGRPGGPLKEAKLIELELRQIQYLNALIETSTLGRPPFTTLVRQAIDMYIAVQLAKPDIRAAVEEYLGRNRRNIIREVISGDKK
jgi:hypothetical protein